MWLWIILALVVLAVVVGALIEKKAAPEPEADGWETGSPVPWDAVGGSGASAERLTLIAVTVTWDKDLTKLHVGDVTTGTVRVNGVLAPVATKCQWAMDKIGIVEIAQSTTTPGLNRALCKAPGTVRLIALAGGGYSPLMSATVAAAVPTPPVPVPVPPAVLPPLVYPLPARHAPAAEWHRLRDWISLCSTDFYYNWTKWTAGDATPMEATYAKRYDVVYSGGGAHVLRMKEINPRLKHLPYSLQITTMIDAPGKPKTAGQIQTKYLDSFVAWCAMNAISPANAEAAWLHDASGARIIPHVWDSPRNVGDPRSDVFRRFTVWRYEQMALDASADGFFIDEYGQGGVVPLWSMAVEHATNPLFLAQIEAAHLSLVTLIADTLAGLGKQLVVNTASYKFPFDAACVKNALGTHMEQTNNPLASDLASVVRGPGNLPGSGNPPTTWNFIDDMLVAGAFVNLVPPYQFGEYESQVGGMGPTHMDTPRGKLAELASYYMVVTDPALLTLSIENGDWAKYTPTQNYVAQIDADIGRPAEARVKPTGMHYYQRRFTKGLVLFNPIYSSPTWDKTKQDYGLATTITLPTDRKYYHVQAEGSIAATPSTTIVLRMPEGAIFQCK